MKCYARQNQGDQRLTQKHIGARGAVSDHPGTLEAKPLCLCSASTSPCWHLPSPLNQWGREVVLSFPIYDTRAREIPTDAFYVAAQINAKQCESDGALGKG
jgi:hypothetical protein